MTTGAGQRVGRCPDDLPDRRSVRAVEGHGDLAAGVAVELDRRRDVGHVATIDGFGRLDGGDRRVARGDGRADQDRVDRYAPRRQAVDYRRGVLDRRGVLPAVGQQDDAEDRRVGRGGFQRLRECRLPVGLAIGRIVRPRRSAKRAGQRREVGRGRRPGERHHFDGVFRGEARRSHHLVRRSGGGRPRGERGCGVLARTEAERVRQGLAHRRPNVQDPRSPCSATRPPRRSPGRAAPRDRPAPRSARRARPRERTPRAIAG